jgi:hypothetical protein
MIKHNNQQDERNLRNASMPIMKTLFARRTEGSGESRPEVGKSRAPDQVQSNGTRSQRRAARASISLTPL